ncbi:acyltransferase family protein [Pyxidicoccus xibeiensis]|uniref:acyltransferase family protein n=1 Tax=Pyxidicoccus xibeiensis TaxID=2906759 RepID=UPI0020A7C855|nr:acyltransferase family protein [Pyxidicoccus xibeiensis]MCP3139720.1 acyltransferase [Pyxidicoccus xibeiensis]
MSDCFRRYDAGVTPPGRVPLFENARGLLIVLVVVGHSLEPLIGREPLAKALYTGLYLFHIPAFAFLSGHLSRAELDRKVVLGIAWSLLAPLAIFQALYVAFDVWVLERPWTPQWLVQPYWVLWFLWSLACWRLLLPLLRRVPMPLGVSVAIALGAGLIPWVGYLFGVSRTLVFLPCFVAGHVVRREWLLSPNPAWERGIALAVFAVLGGFVSALALGMVAAPDLQWLYGSSGYRAIGVAPLSGISMRLGFLGCALALTWSFFMLCPRGDGALTRFGGRSLAPFLLHGFFVRGLAKAGLFSALHGVQGVALAIAGGALLAVLLGHPLVVGLTRPLWEPRWLFQRG